MATTVNFYQLLGIEMDASAEHIKRVFREIASRLHPDKNYDHSVAERFKNVTNACNVLKDVESRRAYDLKLGAEERPTQQSACPASWPVSPEDNKVVHFGNLDEETDEQALREMLEKRAFKPVHIKVVAYDTQGGKTRVTFANVTFGSTKEAGRAVETYNGIRTPSYRSMCVTFFDPSKATKATKPARVVTYRRLLASNLPFDYNLQLEIYLYQNSQVNALRLEAFKRGECTIFYRDESDMEKAFEELSKGVINFKGGRVLIERD